MIYVPQGAQAEDITSETELESNKEIELQRNIVKKNENMAQKLKTRLSENDIESTPGSFSRSKSPIQMKAENYIKNAI